MSLSWNDIAFFPDEALVAEIAKEWKWLLGDESWSPVICSRLGDVFIERKSGRIDWLNCSAGTIEVASPNRGVFDKTCSANGEEVDEWFGANFIATLHEAGKIAGEEECYLFIILPIFAQCEYKPDNIAVVPVKEVFLMSSHVHKQIADLPDGTKVQMKIVD
jgi:hypothetical protein